VAIPAVASVRGLAAGGVSAPARALTSRLGLGSALRGLAEDRVEVVAFAAIAALRAG